MTFPEMWSAFTPRLTRKFTATAESQVFPLEFPMRRNSSRGLRILVDGQDGLVFVELGDQTAVAVTDGDQVSFPIFAGSEVSITNEDLSPYIALCALGGDVDVYVTVGRGI